MLSTLYYLLEFLQNSKKMDYLVKVALKNICVFKDTKPDNDRTVIPYMGFPQKTMFFVGPFDTESKLLVLKELY